MRNGRLIGLTIARNEDWILGFSMRVALMWCDELVILNHASTDGTADILSELEVEYPSRVHVFEESDPVWYEMKHRQFTLDKGRELGGTHFAIIDGDEVPTWNLINEDFLTNAVSHLKPRGAYSYPMLPLWRSPTLYRVDNCVWTRARIPILFRGGAGIHWKANKGYEHHARLPRGCNDAIKLLNGPQDGGFMHYQFANWRRLKAKHAHYKMMETIRYPGRERPARLNNKYNLALNEKGMQSTVVPWEFIEGYSDLLAQGHLRISGVPWYEDECKRLMTEHGKETFKGLNLFGVI